MSTQPVQVTEPTRLTQGESAEWRRCFKKYSPDEWTLQYRFRGLGTGFNVDAIADGSAFAAAITSTETADAAVNGRYQWQAWVTNIADTSIVRMIDEGVTVIERGFTNADVGSVDLRSTAKKTLDAIDAAMLTDSASSVLSYEITTPAGTRKIMKVSRSEAINQRKYYAGVVARENAAESVRNGGPLGQKIGVRMP